MPETSNQESLEDRIANKFNPNLVKPDEEPEGTTAKAEKAEEPEAEVTEPESAETEKQTSEESDGEQAEAVEVELNGVVYQVPPELKDGYMRQNDYTAKTTELQAQRSLVEQQTQSLELAQREVQFIESIAEPIQQLAYLDSQVKMAESVDWNSMTSEAMFRKKMEIDSIKDSRAELEKTLQGQKQQFQQQQDVARQGMLDQADAYLTTNVAGWGDDMKKELSSVAKANYGFSSDEISQVTDTRMLLVLHDAMQYRKLKAGASDAVKVAAKAPPVVKPTGKRELSTEKAKQMNKRKAIINAKTSSERNKVVASLYEDKIARFVR